MYDINLKFGRGLGVLQSYYTMSCKLTFFVGKYEKKELKKLSASNGLKFKEMIRLRKDENVFSFIFS